MTKIAEKIRKLKKSLNAVILVHNYQIPEVQDIADYLGDSLGLSRIAADMDSSVIVFCGVHFMAETASILSPDKKVLLPEETAGCPMADMITREDLLALKKKHPDAVVVSYVNTDAAVKAETDICCTSANAVKVINSIQRDREIIFVPDKYLGTYAAGITGRRLILWNGYCPTHVKILPEDIKREKELHPKAKILAHPECIPEVVAEADSVESTSGMLKYARKADYTEFIIATETGLIYTLEKQNPGKRFYPASASAVCPNMKKTTAEKVLWALEDMKHEVKVPENIRVRAKKAVDRMLEAV